MLCLPNCFPYIPLFSLFSTCWPLEAHFSIFPGNSEKHIVFDQNSTHFCFKWGLDLFCFPSVMDTEAQPSPSACLPPARSRMQSARTLNRFPWKAQPNHGKKSGATWRPGSDGEVSKKKKVPDGPTRIWLAKIQVGPGWVSKLGYWQGCCFYAPQTTLNMSPWLAALPTSILPWNAP